MNLKVQRVKLKNTDKISQELKSKTKIRNMKYFRKQKTKLTFIKQQKKIVNFYKMM